MESDKRKLKNTLYVLSAVLVFACKGNTNTITKNALCSDVSVRLMHSIVESQLNLLKKASENLKQADSATIRDLKYYISDFSHTNTEFLIAAGGFRPGKNINLVDPCQKGESITRLAQKNIDKLKYKNFVAILLKAKLLEKGQDENLYFIIDSRFCKTTCVFSDNNLSKETVSTIMLENMILQLTILDCLP